MSANKAIELRNLGSPSPVGSPRSQGSGGGLFSSKERNSVNIQIDKEMSFVEDPRAEKSDQPTVVVDKLGTLKGVFLPCVQNILGVILFLRLPWITAQAGVVLTSVIIFLCVTATFLTALSMSAIATNGKIQAGGPYYIISRNLGLELGGAIGVLFYLGTTIAASMYMLGGVEAFQTGFGAEDVFTFDMQLEAILGAFVLTMIVRVGVKYVNMSANVFLGVTLCSVFSLVLGVILWAKDVDFGAALSGDARVSFDNMGSAFEEDPETGITPTFTSLIAIFFPSVTGIMAGSNRSGVLKDSSRSIPTGTLGAISMTTCIYLTVVWVYGCVIANQAMKDDKLIVTAVAWPHEMVVNVGIIMSCVGAGLQSLTGAPRLLSAIAQDDVVPFLRFVAPPPGEDCSEAAIWVTFVIASLPCLAGNLDFITPIITMFFLLMYGAVNLSCFSLAALRSPGFRPAWRYFHWSTALFGFVFCLALMLVINYYVAAIAIFLTACLLLYIKLQGASKDWGDALRGFKFNMARDLLLGLNSDHVHAKNWRPQLLVALETDAAGNPQKPELLSLAGQLKKGRGLLLAASIHLGYLPEEYAATREPTAVLRRHLDEEGILGFARVSMCTSVESGFWGLLQNSGAGSLKPNTILLGWPTAWRAKGDQGEGYCTLLKSVVAMGNACVVLKGGSKLPISTERVPDGTIDIWWIVHDGGLLLLIPHLLRLHKTWRKTKLRLFTAASDSDNSIEMSRRLKRYLANLRIDAEVHVVELASADITNAAAQRTLDMRARRELLMQLESTTMTVAVRDEENDPKPMPLSSIFAQLEDVADGKEGEEGGEARSRSPSAAVSEGGGGRGRTASSASSDGGRGRKSSLRIDNERMETAMKLNAHFREHSEKAHLVITNLPLTRAVHPSDFMEYVDALTEGLDNVLLLRGSGQEIVTTFG